jgi:defect-in-organelle-trafficking protein DotD
MKFVENGKRLDLRPVNVRMKGVTPDALLRNLGNQMHAGADVILDRQAKMVIIEYKNRDAAEQNVQKGS